MLHKTWVLAGIGFLAGTIGVKILTSKPAKDLYVQGVAAGMRAKAGYEEIIEEAKASVDDIVAEASYINETKEPAPSGDTGSESPIRVVKSDSQPDNTVD